MDNTYNIFSLSDFDLSDQSVIDEISNSLKEKLNKFGGKLYKYYGLSGTPNYTISNIKNDILYMNTPEFFNDPFDCNLGIETDSVLIHFAIALLCEEKLNFKPEQAEAFYRFMVGEKLSARELDFLNLQIEIYAPELQKGSAHEWTSKSIVDRFKLFGQLVGMNYEEIQTTIDLSHGLTQLHENVEEEINRNFVIACFSESYKNELLWSHYAEKHQGICVEYDFSRLFSSNSEDVFKLLHLYQVIYSDDRPCIPLTVGIKGELQYVLKEGTYKRTDKIIALLTKSKVWQYEKEWRLIMPSLEYKFLDFPIISRIYLGAKISEENKKSMKELASRKNIELCQMNMHAYRYEFLDPSIVKK